MPLYTFYPCRPDGSSESFIAAELADDDEAVDRARIILHQHPSATRVAVWCGERKVLARSQGHPDQRAVLSQARSPDGPES
jgi:hypothetical protein